MIYYQTVFYDNNILSKYPLTIEKYKLLIKQVKENLKIDKIVYEKEPKKIDRMINFDRDRLISEYDDKLLIFAIGNPNTVSSLLVKNQNKDKYISVFNGKCMVINKMQYMDDIEVKQYNLHLFSSVLCDFAHYHIQKFTNKHKLENFDLNKNFKVI